MTKMTKSIFPLHHDPELAKIFDEMIVATVKPIENHPLNEVSHFSSLATLFKEIKCDQFVKSALKLSYLEAKDKPIEITLISSGSDSKTVQIDKYEHQFLTLMGICQDSLMRPAETKELKIERGDIPEAEHFKEEKNRRIILNAFTALGISTPLYYTGVGDADICLILVGGFSFRVWNRIMKTVIPFLQNHKVVELIVAGGVRPLREKEDKLFLKQTFPEKGKEINALENELDALQFIIKILQTDSEYSALFKGLNITFTSTLPKPGFYRAHTDDVAEEIKVTHNPKVELVTDAPFSWYQLETHRLKMKNRSIQAIGAGADPNYRIEDHYDALGRLFYVTAQQVILHLHSGLTSAEIDTIMKKYKTDYSNKCTSVITENTEKYLQTLQSREIFPILLVSAQDFGRIVLLIFHALTTLVISNFFRM